MSEATSTAAAGLALGTGGAGSTTTGAGLAQVATVFFVAMGLQPELLFAGMWGALASIIFFGHVPLEEKTWQGRVAQTVQRLMVVIVSAIMAGYTAPFVGEIIAMVLRASEPHKALLFTAFVIGAGGQVFLRKFIARYSSLIEKVPSSTPQSHAGK